MVVKEISLSLSSLSLCRNAKVKSRLSTHHFITEAVNIVIYTTGIIMNEDHNKGVGLTLLYKNISLFISLKKGLKLL